MTDRDLIDPEARVPLDGLLQMMPGGLNAIADINERRAAAAAIFASVRTPDNPNVAKEDRKVPGAGDEPGIAVRIYRPTRSTGPLPGIYFVHGGGMILGNLDAEDPIAAMICDRINAIVVSVEYRLAPEHPYPTPLEDCYSGLAWTAENAHELGIDPKRLGVYGASAGGGLAIATALLARDRGGPALKFLASIYPMIDDRNVTPSANEITDIGVWDRAGNIEAWEWYLGGKAADQYAAPTRAGNLAGLPPTFIDVGTLDLFRDEDIAFAQRLMSAGVPTELHVHPGSYHIAEVFAADSALAHRIWTLRLGALERGLSHGGPV